MCALDDLIKEIEEAAEAREKAKRQAEDELLSYTNPIEAVKSMLLEVEETEDKYGVTEELSKKFASHFVAVGMPGVNAIIDALDTDEGFQKLATLVSSAIKNGLEDDEEVDNGLIVQIVGTAMAYTYGLFFKEQE